MFTYLKFYKATMFVIMIQDFYKILGSFFT